MLKKQASSRMGTCAMLILWTRRLQRFFGVEQRFGGSAKDSSARSPEKVPRTCHIYHPLTSTLPETRMAPENWWLEYDHFLLRWPIFMCEMFSFGECKSFNFGGIWQEAGGSHLQFWLGLRWWSKISSFLDFWSKISSFCDFWWLLWWQVMW